jgi:ApaG protein
LPARDPSGSFASVSTATTQGIRITVSSRYLPEQSGQGRWAFSYKVRIENVGDSTAQLKSRHWIILDGNGKREDVRGEGVVGKQPVLDPGDTFEYSSGAVLQAPHGSMRGTYQMVRDDGDGFEAVIAPFPLMPPGPLN